MKVLICPDKFKGTLTSLEVCRSVKRGLLHSGINVEIFELPLADGGDGTLDVLLWHLKGRLMECEVHDPLLRKISASYGLSEDKSIAYIEMARASGLNLLKPSEYNAKKTSTLGTGELINHALLQGVKRIVLGIGGSATNDAGMGAASALGFKFLDREGNVIPPTGENMIKVHTIDNSNIHPRLKDVSIIAMCDVTNPFFGPTGAAFTYAQQKGASEKDIKDLDDGLHHIAGIFNKTFSIDLQQRPGAGAGGGIAGGLHVLLNVVLKPSTEIIFDLVQLREVIERVDIVITGEGKIDRQTVYGKLIARVAEMSRSLNKRTIALCGINELTREEAAALGIDEVLSLKDFAGEDKALKHGDEELEKMSATQLSNALAKAISKL